MSDSDSAADVDEPAAMDTSLFEATHLEETFEDPYSGEERTVTVEDTSENELRYYERVAEQRAEGSPDLDANSEYERLLWENHLIAVDGDRDAAEVEYAAQPVRGRIAIMEAVFSAWGLRLDEIDELIEELQDQGN